MSYAMEITHRSRWWAELGGTHLESDLAWIVLSVEHVDITGWRPVLLDSSSSLTWLHLFSSPQLFSCPQA